MSDNIADLELERIARMPMLDTNLKTANDLVKAFVTQLAYLGHKELAGTFPVGTYIAEIQVSIRQAEVKP